MSIRIDFEPSGSALGPGMVQLLELISEKGSLRAAATTLGMSYRKAWLLIQDVQKTFNGTVVAATSGGSSGGGTQLTTLGEEVVRLYRRMESRATEASAAECVSLADMVKETAPRRRRRAKPKTGRA